MASSLTSEVSANFLTAARVLPPRKFSMVLMSSSSESLLMQLRPLRISEWLLWEPKVMSSLRQKVRFADAGSFLTEGQVRGAGIGRLDAVASWPGS